MMRMVLLIILTSGAILSASYMQGQKQVSEVAPDGSIDDGIQLTQEKLSSLFEQVNRNLLIARGWIQSLHIDIHDVNTLNSLFIPVLQEYPHISSVLLADNNGKEWMLLRDGNGWVNRLSDTAEWGTRSRWLRYDASLRVVEDSWKEVDYDPLQRPWYTGASKLSGMNAIHWTEPYIFFTTKDPGITASSKFPMDPEHPGQFRIIAFDVMLMSLSKFTTSIAVSEHGMTIVTSSDGTVLGLPRNNRFESDEAIRRSVLKNASQLGIAPLTNAFGYWRETDGDKEESFRFKSTGGHWRAGFKPFTLGANTDLWIGVIVPESDFMGLLVQWRNSIIVATMIVLFLTIWMAHGLAKRYSRPLEALAAESKRIRYRAAALEEISSLEAKNSLGKWVMRKPFKGMGQSGIVEIDVMLNNIKDMANQLEEKTKQSQMYSQVLEKRVAERTEDLASKNRDLEETLLQVREMQRQLIMQEKLASLGNLVAGVAHEVNNPTGAVNSAADVSLRCVEKMLGMLEKAGEHGNVSAHPEFRRMLKVLDENNRLIVSAGERIAKLVRGLKNFARLDEAELQTVDIHEGIESTLLLVHHELKNRIEVKREYGTLPKITCYPNQLNQVFMNLFVNAAHAIEGAGTITITTRAGNGSIRVLVADNGKGIEPEHLEKIFEPGFTTKGVGVGTGLGLPISYNIIQNHHGTLEVESEPGKGSVFTITLPVEGEKHNTGTDIGKKRDTAS